MLNFFQRNNALEDEFVFVLSLKRKGLKALKNKRARLRERVAFVCNGDKSQVFNAMKEITSKEHSQDFTDDDIKALFDDIIRREDEKMNAEIELSQPEQFSVDTQEGGEA